MTTTTLTSSLSSGAPRLVCIDHGVLADDAVVCARCGSKPWDLTNAEQRQRVAAYQKTALKTRARNFAIVASVSVNVVTSMLASMADGGLHLRVDLGVTVVGAAVGFAAAWALRPRAVHALARAVKAHGAK
jgi:hypothetical protein